MIIGYGSNNYNYKRNIVGQVDGYRYRKVYDLFSAMRAINRWFKGNSPKQMTFLNQYNDLGLNSVGVLHFWNVVSHGRTPWVTTFESELPRFSAVTDPPIHDGVPDYAEAANDRSVQKAIEAMASPFCKRLLALSACSAAMQRELLACFPAQRAAIEAKLEVLHPPQKLEVNSFSEKRMSMDGPITFMFVGAAFHRKGGLETIETLHSLRNESGYDINLVIVSSLRIDSYATGETVKDIVAARHFINQNADWITYHDGLPNPEVLKLMRRAHVGLLPTYADTYGYSVLEFQAAGCPVISTNVRALGEINNDSMGWLIDVPRNRLGEGLHYCSLEDRTALGRAIRAGIKRAVDEIYGDRHIVAAKSERSIANIRDNHDPARFSERLRLIYLSAAAHGVGHN